MSTQYFDDIEQGTADWHKLRCGIITASEIGKLLTPKLGIADNETSRALIRKKAAERLTGITEDTYVSYDMERGTLDEPYAREAYADWAGVDVKETGFAIHTFDNGIKLGCSPDGLVGRFGGIEIKSRKHPVHISHVIKGEVPSANMAQIQSFMMVTGAHWCDYVSFSSGLPLWVKRVTPDTGWHQAIVEAVFDAEQKILETIDHLERLLAGFPPTEYLDHDMLNDKDLIL